MFDRIAASSLRVGFDTLRANPLRTLLSTLGIIMGVGALVSVLSLGDGMERYAREQIARTTDLQTISVKLPAIVTTDLRLNEPRYASLPNIMKAKKKPLDETTPADYGVDVTPRLKVLKTVEPATRKSGVKVGSVDELIDKLRTEAGVL